MHLSLWVQEGAINAEPHKIPVLINHCTVVSSAAEVTVLAKISDQKISHYPSDKEFSVS